MSVIRWSTPAVTTRSSSAFLLERQARIVIYNAPAIGAYVLTYADGRKTQQSGSLWPRHPLMCYLVSHAIDPHQLDAVWRDGNHIEVSSPDELDKYDVGLPEHTCKDIDIEVVYTSSSSRHRSGSTR